MAKPIGPAKQEESEGAKFELAVREGIAEADAGKCIPYEKIRRWVLTWGSEKELPPPK